MDYQSTSTFRLGDRLILYSTPLSSCEVVSIVSERCVYLVSRQYLTPSLLITYSLCFTTLQNLPFSNRYVLAFAIRFGGRY